MTAIRKTRVVNLYQEDYDVYIGRAGRGFDGYFGNPFLPEGWHSSTERELAIAKYTEYFHRRVATDQTFAQRVLDLRGCTLGCFCKPMPCHGDVIAEFVNTVKCTKCHSAPAETTIADVNDSGGYRSPYHRLVCGLCCGQAIDTWYVSHT